ncbi:BUD4 [Sanghuangporus vaninii]
MPLPPPPSHSSASPSTPLRPRADRMKDSILKESSAGWASAITPLRIAKRDQLSPSSSSSPNPGAQDPSRVVARRSSNSYKHVFTSNLVSRSPFKTQLGPRQQPSAPSSYTRPIVPVTRKVSGEKRPRPESLIQQAESENAKRVTELGYRRRQSRGFQGLVEKNPVSRSPFRQLLSPGREAKESKGLNEERNPEEYTEMNAPIAIEFPTKGDDTTSPETTETDSSLNSRGSEQRPRTPPMHPTPPQIASSPGFERRSPVPSALQGSPARSSLAQKSRLLGPRSRSLSAGASGTSIADLPPRRERRKTVTFDERCDVVEFDRDSCEDAVFDTDDEDVYGAPELQQTSSQEVSLETSEYFDASELNDSINGLVETMLKEANNLAEPSTPEQHTASLSSIVSDVDMMPGGAEDGVPLGRLHRAERVRAHRHDESILELPPPTFSAEDDFFSTPPRQEIVNADHRTPRPFETPRPSSHGKMALPPDTELDEDGIPLGRTHHAERARAVHESGEDFDIKMMPPSPLEDVVPSVKQEFHDPLVPRFDLHLDDLRTSSPRGPTKESKLSNDDVFGPTNETSGMLGELDFEHANVDPDLSLNASVASFHEIPPQDGLEYSDNGHDQFQEREPYDHVQDFSFGGRSDKSLDNIVSGLRLREDFEESHDCDIPHQEHERERTESSRSGGTVTEAVRSEPRRSHEIEHDGLVRTSSPVGDRNHNTDFAPHSPRSDGLYAQREIGSASSLVGSDGRRSMSPRINREDVLRKLSRQRSAENYSPLGTPALASSVSSMPKVEEAEREDVKMEVEELSQLPPTPSQIDRPQSRPPLEERLKRALSPSLPAPAPVRPSVVPSASPAPPSPAGPSHGPAPVPQPPVEGLPITRDAPISSPPRVGQHGRARTYDFDERPPSAPAKIVSSRSPVSSSFDFNRPGVDIGDMDMRSALDRLVDDVSIASGVEPSVGNNSRAKVDVAPQEGDVSMTDTELITEESTELLANLRESVRGKPPLQRSGTAPPPNMPTTSTPERPPISRSVSEVSMMGGSSAAGLLKQTVFATSEPFAESDDMDTDVPPPLPPKTPEKSARQTREEMIKEKRKEARMRESGEYFVPPRRDASGKLIDESPASKRRSGQRPSAGRSMSTGDAEDILNESASAQRRVSVLRHRRGGVLGVDLDDDDGMLSDSIQRELKKRDDPKKTYELRERDAVVYASSSQEAAMAQVDPSLDIEDKAWRAVRRPSDMNEYNQEIKAIRAMEKPGKAHGKVFVKVLKLKGLTVPIPPQLTMFSLTLNNGVHYVTTPECRLTREARIEQEFELLEHSKLEFTLTVNIRRDPHILQQFKAITPPAVPPQAVAPSPTQHRGMRSFFGGTPKKPKVAKHSRSQTEPLVRFEMQENLARYMKQDGTLARAFIAFKDIARHCDSRLFESAFPLIGQRLEAPGEGGGAGGTMKPQPIGEIVLQIFRLPPIPGLTPNQLPQSLDECHRGLKTIGWHKKTYHEGVLTQLGGDCSTWRRRQLRVIGGSLVAFNDVTKRAMAAIDLKKAIAIEDDQDPEVASKRRDVDDYDAMYGVERSFRLVFPNNQEITFFADTDEEKANWLSILRCLVGHIPPHALWAELLWQKKHDPRLAQQAQEAAAVRSS